MPLLHPHSHIAPGLRPLCLEHEQDIADYAALRYEVMFYFSSESDFWRFNRGYYLLSPKQQEDILAMFRRRGYDTTNFRFAHYVEQFDLIGNAKPYIKHTRTEIKRPKPSR